MIRAMRHFLPGQFVARARNGGRPAAWPAVVAAAGSSARSEEHTSELQSLAYLVCRLLLETKKHTSELQSLAYLVCRLLLEKKKHTSERHSLAYPLCPLLRARTADLAHLMHTRRDLRRLSV